MFFHELAYRPAPATHRATRRTGRNIASVNVRENDTQYELHLLAPGRSKEAFKISVDPGKVLHISAEIPESTEENWLHQEFKILPFKRSVKLSDSVDTSKISATYNDGILVLSLPKLETANQTNLEIPVL